MPPLRARVGHDRSCYSAKARLSSFGSSKTEAAEDSLNGRSKFARGGLGNERPKVSLGDTPFVSHLLREFGGAARI